MDRMTPDIVGGQRGRWWGRTRPGIAAALAVGALGIGAIAPAGAATDPEDAFLRKARAAGIDAFETTTPSDATSLRVLGRLLSPAAANSRISSLLPARSRSRTIGPNYSVDVVDVASGARIWARRSERPMLPASNMKIVTAANVLRAYGPDHRFHTTVSVAQPGTVVLKGGGDTALTTGDLDALAAKTAENIGRQGLEPPTKPDGTRARIRVMVDDSVFPSPSGAPGWPSSYQPGIVRPVSALGVDGHYVWDAAADAGRIFAGYLKEHGYSAKFAGRDVATGTVVADHPSRPLSTQVRFMLQISENNAAEMMFRLVALARGLQPTWRASRQAAAASLSELGISTEGLALVDGSGVSRSDRLTARALADLLRVIADAGAQPRLEPVYHGGGLPLAGVSGTLASANGRFTTRPSRCARGRIRAKTGTLYDTVALSGLTTGADGRLKAFSILVNNRPYRRYPPLATRRSVDAIAATVTGCW